MKAEKVAFRDLGTIDYKKAWDIQEYFFSKAVAAKLKNRASPEVLREQASHILFFCEHPHVYTLGKSGSEKHLLINEQTLSSRGATFYRINRGGDITYHGPGQLVGYPIFDLDYFFTDIHKYMRLLEEVIIRTLDEYLIKAGRIKGLTGVWLDPDSPRARKICAFGIRCSRWVTMHGFSFNVNTDLSYFRDIIPCGIADKSVTSLSKELGTTVDIGEVKSKLKKYFSEIFEIEIVEDKEESAVIRGL